MRFTGIIGIISRESRVHAAGRFAPSLVRFHISREFIELIRSFTTEDRGYVSGH